MTPAPIHEYKMSIDITSRDHALLNDTVIDILNQLNKIPDVNYELSPLLGREVEAT
jgi:hypothetical protein